MDAKLAKVIYEIPTMKLSPEDATVLAALKADSRLDLSSEAVDILFNRGFRTVEDIEHHLYAGMEDMHPTALMKDADIFCQVVKKAIEDGIEMVNYSDYDADGVTASAVTLLGIRGAGGNIHPFTNNRFVEGYGINKAGVDRMRETYPNATLIITTDNGIVAHEGIEYAQSLGYTVLVTDHHEQGDKIPVATAVVNPKQHACEYPFDSLCGVGVMFKLLIQLYWEMGLDLTTVYDLLDIVAMGTVGDLVPLVGENRILVREGLKRVRREDRAVFRKLRVALGVNRVDEETFGFLYCPILNALGRLDGSPEQAIELLTTSDEARMDEIIVQLVALNDFRKDLTKTQEQLALAKVEAWETLPSVIVLADESYHEGVVGLVAGRIKEQYHRPTIVLASHKQKVTLPDGTEEEVAVFKGSARSIEGLHIKEAFDAVSEHLVGYGGHAMAGGMTVRADALEAFISAIQTYAEGQLTDEQYKKRIVVDSVVRAQDVTIELVDEFEVLRPFGMQFHRPRFALSEYRVNQEQLRSPYVGADKRTLRLVSQEGLTLLMFKYAELYQALGEPETVKAVGMPQLNTFNGKTSTQFLVEGTYLHRG